MDVTHLLWTFRARKGQLLSLFDEEEEQVKEEPESNENQIKFA